MIDVSNPAVPFETGFLETQGSAREVFVSGNYACVADGEYGIRIINISNPAVPIEVGFYDTTGPIGDVFVSGDYAYVSENYFDFNYALRIIDVSNPMAPVETGFLDTLWVARDVFVSGKYAFVLDYGQLHIIDVSNSAAPFEIGVLAQHIPYRVFVEGNYAYVAFIYNEYFNDFNFSVIDVSNPSNPIEVGSINPTTSESPGIIVSGNYAYVGDGCGFLTMDISNKTSFMEVKFIQPPGCSLSSVTSNYAYGTGCRDGFKIIDVSNSAAPSEKVIYDTRGPYRRVFVSGKYAYANCQGGIQILDVSNPAAPVEAGFYDTGYYLNFVSGIYAYCMEFYDLFNTKSRLHIINVGNPIAPYEAGSYDMPTYYRARVDFVSEKYAYVLTGDEKVRILNVSNPIAPFEAGFYDTPEDANGVYVCGDFAYVTYIDSGFRIINVSNPSAPLLLAFYGSTTPRGIYVEGNYAFLADYFLGLRIIDIRNPYNPYEVGFYKPDYLPSQAGTSMVRISGDYAFVMERDASYIDAGFSIYSYISTLYVDIDFVNNCNENTPCFFSIQQAIESADPISKIKITQGDYDESCWLDSPKTVRLEGGYDSTYSNQVAYSTIESLVIEDGTIVVENLIIGQ